MDYGFSPGGDAVDLQFRQLFADRVMAGAGGFDTTVIRGPTHIAGFLDELATTSSVTKPVGDLLIASHANDGGWLEIGLDGSKAINVRYADLLDVLADVGRRARLRIPATLLATPPTTRVLIRGCRIGEAPKFVDKLKEVLGNQAKVIAPRHFTAVQTRDRRNKRGVVTAIIGTFEYLAYGFKIVSKTALERPALLTAFRDRNPKFTEYTGGTAKVADDLWDQWLPDKVGKGKQRIPFEVQLGQTVDGLPTLPAVAEFRHETPPFGQQFTNSTAAQRTKAGLKAFLAARPDFQSTYGFPTYERYGFADFDKFFEGFEWTPSKKASANPFVWNGTRHVYTIIIPVCTPPLKATGNALIYNYFPVRTSSTAPIKMLDETDGRLFYTTP